MLRRCADTQVKQRAESGADVSAKTWFFLFFIGSFLHHCVCVCVRVDDVVVVAGILEVLHCVLVESPEALNIIKEGHIKSIISLLDKHGRNHKVQHVPQTFTACRHEDEGSPCVIYLCVCLCVCVFRFWMFCVLCVCVTAWLFAPTRT